jgi:hypothetical protein
MEMKIVIDRDRSICGRWIMTGSRQFVLMDGTGH